ncbi:MAG: GDSL-type esterase/lipase family protein [Chitinophagales bacterium]|nr:GDSL-type esterase/lipase family protein [Chitinophagales bacterium]MDW8418218.1 GDSL-type esterase/lipase family protein [Chitinophagales bacterium]
MRISLSHTFISKFFITATVTLIHIAAFAQVCPPVAKTRVMLLGDSWTHIMWNNLTYRDVFHQFGFADWLEQGQNTAIGGTTAHYWAQPNNLSVIVNHLQQNTDIQIVVLSIGGNDMLAGINGPIPGWHTGLSAADETTLLNQIEANMQTIINAIKNVRPDIEIVFSGYDYINLVETIANNQSAALLWLNLGQPTPYQLNMAFSRLEQRKINIANNDPRVYYVNAMGLMQHIYGYPNIFPPYSVPAPGLLPPGYAPFPGGDPNFPTPPVALALNGTDAVHLSDEGYRHLVVHQMVGYFHQKMRGNPTATFISEGGWNDGWVRSDGSTGVGNIRMGDHSNGSMYRGIVSFNTSSIPDQATITRASIFLNRSSLTGSNPLSGTFLGTPRVDIKHGSYGAPHIESSDYAQQADAYNIGCFIGTAPHDGYTIRIDISPSALHYIHKQGLTQFRIYFPQASGFFSDYVQFHNGNQPGLLAPYLDVHYTLPPPPASAALSGNATICHGASAPLQVQFTGTPPFHITWSDGVTQSGINTFTHTRHVSPTVNTTYAIVGFQDAYGQGSITGSASVHVLPPVQVSVSGLLNHYCSNTPASVLTATPPGGVWSGAGISGNQFDPALSLLQNGGPGAVILHYTGIHNGCPYQQTFPVYVDTNTCTLNGTCITGATTGNAICAATGTTEVVYPVSGTSYVFHGLQAGRTYRVQTCDSCHYDSFLSVRNAADSSFIAENDDACGVQSSVVFIAPVNGTVQVRLTHKTLYSCQPYLCQPHPCSPNPCNPYPCQPYSCNCQTCYQTCYQDELVYMSCYPSGIQIINGILTSDCIGACTGGFCWRLRYQVPYNCNPYSCNCQTCYQTCYDTCYQTCYDTCYLTCSDPCGTGLASPCKVTLTCLNCHPPLATISSSSTQSCAGNAVSFQANVTGKTCKTQFLWSFGNDATPAVSTIENPPAVTWHLPGAKTVTLIITEPGVGADTFTYPIMIYPLPKVDSVTASTPLCTGDTIVLTAHLSGGPSGLVWALSGNVIEAYGAYCKTLTHDTVLQYSVTPYIGNCTGDTVTGAFAVSVSPHVHLYALSDTGLCPGETVTLYAGAPGITLYDWLNQGNPIYQGSAVFQTAIPGVYRVRVTHSNGCTSVSNSLTVLEYPAPQVLLTGPWAACPHDSVALHASVSNATTVIWTYNHQPINGAADTIFYATPSGLYQVIAHNLFCTDTAGIFLQSYPLPSINAGPDLKLCIGDTAVLNVTGNGLYQWSNGQQGASVSIAPVVSTIYTVTATNNHGCTATDSVAIQVNTPPQGITIQQNGGSLLAPSNYTGYQWLLNHVPIPGANSPYYVPVQAGVYTVQVTDQNGCVGMSSSFIWTSPREQVPPEGDFILFPNPFEEALHIRPPAGVALSNFQLYDATGRCVYMQSWEGKSQLIYTIRLSDLPAGLYGAEINGAHRVRLLKY